MVFGIISWTPRMSILASPEATTCRSPLQRLERTTFGLWRRRFASSLFNGPSRPLTVVDKYALGFESVGI